MYADLAQPNLPPIVAYDRSKPQGEAISCDEQRLKSRSSTHNWRSRNHRTTVWVKESPHKEESDDGKDQIDRVRVLL
jgi:hypothetical protein